jgi:hypothetical protein
LPNFEESIVPIANPNVTDTEQILHAATKRLEIWLKGLLAAAISGAVAASLPA